MLVASCGGVPAEEGRAMSDAHDTPAAVLRESTAPAAATYERLPCPIERSRAILPAAVFRESTAAATAAAYERLQCPIERSRAMNERLRAPIERLSRVIERSATFYERLPDSMSGGRARYPSCRPPPNHNRRPSPTASPTATSTPSTIKFHPKTRHSLQIRHFLIK